MARIIIGIHGLNNKPHPKVLRDWWIRSIRTGLRQTGAPDIPFRFHLLYWADLLYPAPLDPKILDLEDPRVLVQRWAPLHPGSTRSVPWLRRKVLSGLERISDFLLTRETLFNRFDKATDKLIHNRFHDLAAYFEGETGYGDAADSAVRDVIQERLQTILNCYRDDQILLIAHSMGSIIAYDILSKSGSEVPIRTWLTMGSPLGQSIIQGKLLGFSKPVQSRVKTPENVGRWLNCADLKDWVALDYNLRDDFDPNSRGVLPEDIEVQNTFVYNGVENPHTVFGYLQTPECAALISEFLLQGRSSVSIGLGRLRRRILDLMVHPPYNVNQPSPFPPGTRAPHSSKPSRSKTSD